MCLENETSTGRYRHFQEEGSFPERFQGSIERDYSNKPKIDRENVSRIIVRGLITYKYVLFYISPPLDLRNF